MHHDFCVFRRDEHREVRIARLQGGKSADVVEVPVGEQDGDGFGRLRFERGDNPFGLLAGVDDQRLAVLKEERAVDFKGADLECDAFHMDVMAFLAVAKARVRL